MNLNNYKNWNEVISKAEFETLIVQFIQDYGKYEQNKTIEILEALSDRYTKFYESILDGSQINNLSKILIDLTEFSNRERMENLIGVMFDFKIDSYYDYLSKKQDSIISYDLKKEVKESLVEYKKI